MKSLLFFSKQRILTLYLFRQRSLHLHGYQRHSLFPSCIRRTQHQQSSTSDFYHSSGIKPYYRKTGKRTPDSTFPAYCKRNNSHRKWSLFLYPESGAPLPFRRSETKNAAIEPSSAHIPYRFCLWFTQRTAA